MGFPRYHRSHLKSETFRTLVRILSHYCDESQLSGANQVQELTTHSNGTDRMAQENQEKECEHLKNTGTYFMDPKDPVTQKETQVFETFEGFRVQGTEYKEEFMTGVEEDGGSSGRQDMLICENVDVMPMRANGLNKEPKLIDELNQIVQGTEKLVCDTDLTPLNLGLVEKQNGSSVFNLMDYEVEYAEFKLSDSSTSRTDIGLQAEGEFNQCALEGSRASSMTNSSTSAWEQTSVPVNISTSSINHERQQKEMELMQPVYAAMVSIPTTEESEFEKEEQHGQKVLEAMHFPVDQSMNSGALNLSVKHERQQKKMELVKPDCVATVSLPTTEEGELEKVKQHGQKVPEAMHSVDQGMNNEGLDLSIKHGRQQKEMELMKPVCAAKVSLPTTKEGECEKDEHGRKVPETIHFSVDQGKNSEASNLDEYGGEKMSLRDTDILEAKHAMQCEGVQPEKISCANDAAIFSINQNKEVDFEEGEISGDFRIADNSFDLSSADSLKLQQRKDEDQMPENVVENTVFHINKQNEEKEENYEPTSFMVHAPQDACNSGQAEPSTCNKNGFPSGFDVGTSQDVINYEEVVEHACALERGKSKDKESGMNEAVDSPLTLASNQVLHRGFLEEATKDHQSESAVNQKAGVNCKKKRGPVTAEKKAKKKEKKRKKRAENNRKLGVKRLKLHPVQKPKTVAYCRHYLKGRCHEGDKCKFSHDVVPETKSKPCCHFARHSCMKGDDCPFDHQLSKYPCSNFVAQGSCSRGDSCLFSHQLPTKQDIPTSSNDSRPKLKPQLLSGNTKLSKPLNISGSSASQQKRLFDSKGTQSHINSDHKVADTLQKPTAPVPKGISFMNVSKSSSLNPSTSKQDLVTPKKKSAVQIGTLKDQSASVTAQKLGNPMKMPVVPKGINFLSFGKGRVSNITSSICSVLNREGDINFSKIDSLGSPEQASSSLYKDVSSKIGDCTKQSVLHTAPHAIEILKKNQSVDKGMNLDSSGKVSIYHSANNAQCSLTSHQDCSLIRSVQDGVKSYTSKTSTVTSSMLPDSPFVSGQSSECVASGHHKHIFNSAQRALLSTLSFAAEHESDIKMKCSAGASAMGSEVNKNISNSSS